MNQEKIRSERSENPKRNLSGKKRRRVQHFLACFLVTLCSLAAVVFGGAGIINHGPSPTVRDLFVTSMMETSAAKFLAQWYFSPEQLQEILNANTIQDSGEITDSSLVNIPDETQPAQGEEIEICEVIGDTYKGKMMIVKDPSRVYLSTPEVYGAEVSGMTVLDMMERDGAIAGVNAGGFVDQNGVGNGGQPIGLVISNGVLRSGGGSTETVIAGFDEQDRLIVGSISGQQAQEMKLRDAVTFGPVLIVNGERAKVEGTGGGLNPRTAIGQRADGAVLLLVIDGRQPHSLGATYKDLIDIMEEYGAVNACNMDGGSSSVMYYEQELLSVCASLYGPRKMPTAWLVK